MDLDLAQVAAGLPMALSLALAGGIASFREGRRRSALNEAMHELRRPLQALSLALPADSAGAQPLESSLLMAAAALERLDREINGAAEIAGWESLEIEPLVEVAVERWERPAAGAGRSLRVLGCGAEITVAGDPVQLAQTVDNLISNALRHGAGQIEVRVQRIEKHVCLSIADQGQVKDRRRRGGLRVRLSGRCRHGHGLRVVRRVARAYGGTFRLRSTSAGTEARLELPLDRPGAGA